MNFMASPKVPKLCLSETSSPSGIEAECLQLVNDLG
jgi:hypothetical protein